MFGSKLFASRRAGPTLGQASYGNGNNASTYPSEVEVTGPSSIMPDVIYRAPSIPVMYGGPLGIDIAWKQGRFQSPPDVYSFRVHAPPVPQRYAGYDEIAYQIHRNGSTYGGIALKAPTIPIAGYNGTEDNPLGQAAALGFNVPGVPNIGG